ncbi:hypothetical protein GCM10010294_02620 [Streptomyces griseoloalbus]|nr:hypothetical protein GCM10010294_02620 [Streptomyces griseoloalbus]
MTEHFRPAPGFVQIDRAEYTALKHIMGTQGDMSKLQTMFSGAPRIRENPEAAQEALTVYRKHISRCTT